MQASFYFTALSPPGAPLFWFVPIMSLIFWNVKKLGSCRPGKHRQFFRWRP